jgi:hypothetical protein
MWPIISNVPGGGGGMSIDFPDFLSRDMGARGSVVCLRHYAASPKVAGSSPDEVDFFN